MKYYRSPPLSDVSGEPNANITEFTSGHPKIDKKIHKSPSYQKLKNEWLISRQAYLASKKTSALSNYTNPNLREQNEKKEENFSPLPQVAKKPAPVKKKKEETAKVEETKTETTE